MNPRICILLNNLDEFNFGELLYRYLPIDRFDVEFAVNFPYDPSQFQLIIPWNYRKIIEQSEQYNNVVVMHSSDLPDGRGWAPIYYAFSEGKEWYVMSAIFAANEVDTGDIIMRARFQIEDGYTAHFIRKLDNELTLMLIVKILQQWPEGNIVGMKQVGVGSYRKRRHPKDNEIDVNNTLVKLIPNLRGIESTGPAFFFYNSVKYIIEIYPEIQPSMPKKVFIEYPALNKGEIWEGWA